MIRAVMEEARRQRPCIVFVDEIDSIGRSRTEGEKDSTRRMKNELLKQLDGVGADNKGVVVVGATNAPWEIDPALRRRFEKRIYVPLPDEAARERIIRIHLKGEPSTLTNAHYRRLAKLTRGFSGSDAAQLCREALMEPVRELMRATHFKRVRIDGTMKYVPARSNARGAIATSLFGLKGEDVHCRPVAASDFRSALARVKSTVKTEDLKRHKAFSDKFGGERPLNEKAVSEKNTKPRTNRRVEHEADSMITRLTSWLWGSEPPTLPPRTIRKPPPPVPSSSSSSRTKRPVKTAIPS